MIVKVKGGEAMLGDIDYNKPTCYEKLELILCKPNGEEIAILSEAYDITILSFLTTSMKYLLKYHIILINIIHKQKTIIGV